MPYRALSFVSHCSPVCACLTMFLPCPGVLPPQPTAARLLERSLTPTHLRLSRLQIRSYFWSKQQMRLAGKRWCICPIFPGLGRPDVSDQVCGSLRETSIESVLKDLCGLWFISQREYLQLSCIGGKVREKTFRLLTRDRLESHGRAVVKSFAAALQLAFGSSLTCPWEFYSCVCMPLGSLFFVSRGFPVLSTVMLSEMIVLSLPYL